MSKLISCSGLSYLLACGQYGRFLYSSVCHKAVLMRTDDCGKNFAESLSKYSQRYFVQDFQHVERSIIRGAGWPRFLRNVDHLTMLYPFEPWRFVETRDKHYLVNGSSHDVGDVGEEKFVEFNFLPRGAGSTDIVGIV